MSFRKSYAHLIIFTKFFLVILNNFGVLTYRITTILYYRELLLILKKFLRLETVTNAFDSFENKKFEIKRILRIFLGLRDL